MKRVTLLLGLALSLLLTSCNSDIDNFENQSENTEKRSTLINKQQAKNAAINFIKNNKKTQAKGIPSINEDNLEEIQTLENENGQPVLYVLNVKENNGFIVMSASTLERPVLAYSDKGNFDLATIEEYQGVDDWLLTKYLKINGLEQLGSPMVEDVQKQWNAVGVHIGVGIEDHNGNPINWDPPVLISENTQTHGPLLGEIKWDQRFGTSIRMYNNEVRFNNCTAGTAPAGCVAVAMGQIMKYHNHPNIYNINTMYPYITVDPPYAWDTQYAYDIADLLEDIGINVQMSYSCSGSGAYSSNARTAFNTNYNYTTSNVLPMDLNTIKADVINSKPVYLEGYRTMEVVVTSTPRPFIFRMSIGKTKTRIDYRDGHVWVSDGYEKVTGYYYNPNQNNYFYATIANHIHMNWGWGGARNGWYDYDTWENVSSTIPDSNKYLYYQHMISNITPN